MFALYCNFAAALNKYRWKQEITLKFQSRTQVPEILFSITGWVELRKVQNKLRRAGCNFLWCGYFKDRCQDMQRIAIRRSLIKYRKNAAD